MIGAARPWNDLFTFLNAKNRLVKMTRTDRQTNETDERERAKFSLQVAFVTMQLLCYKLHNFQKLPEDKDVSLQRCRCRPSEGKNMYFSSLCLPVDLSSLVEDERWQLSHVCV